MGNSQNPWFIHNTRSVHYCIIKGQNFSVQADEVDSLIRRAVAWWKTQFERSDNRRNGRDYRIEVATQDFVRQDCGDEPMLTFQLGALSDEQIQKIPRPNELIGIAVRTAYDIPTLRGRGFVYIAADTGPLKPSIVPLGGNRLPDDFWQQHNKGHLYVTLIHELGHVFGVKHWPDTVMAEGYLERSLSFANWGSGTSRSLEDFEPRSIFNADLEMDYTYCNDSIPTYWPVGREVRCIRLLGHYQRGIELRALEDDGEPGVVFGKIPRGSHSSAYSEMVNLFVPRNHSLYSPYSGYLNAVIQITPIRFFSKIVFDQAASAANEPVLITFGASGFKIESVREGADEIRQRLSGTYRGKTEVN